jgi:hypothetical protein
MRFPCQIMFVLLNNNMAGVTYGVGTANPFGTPEPHPWFSVGFLLLEL